jgi:dUTP pyrophosphatase
MPTPEEAIKSKVALQSDVIPNLLKQAHELQEKNHAQLAKLKEINDRPNFELLTGKIYRATEHSAAFDLYYDGKTPFVLGNKAIGIPTGVRTKFDSGYVCIIKEKSGLALKGIELHGGVIDADYRDEWMVIARNPLWFMDPTYDESGTLISHTPRLNKAWKPFVIEPGIRIAQFMFVELPKMKAQVHEGAEIVLSTEERKGGLGSTGLS